MTASTVAQVWCPSCEAEVIVQVREGRRAATCPWCERIVEVPEEATR